MRVARVFYRGWRPAAFLALLLAPALAGCLPETAPGRVERIWGGRGLLPGHFVKPRAIVIDPSDRLFLVDFRAQIQSFDRDGQLLAHWQTPTHERGRPSGLTWSPDGRLWVADSHYHRILVYSPDGVLLETLGGDTGSGPLVGVFGYLADLAFDSRGNLYVAEAQEQERITKLDSQRAIVRQWGGRGPEPGQFSRIRALAFDSADRLFVADACNHRIQVQDTEGRTIDVIGHMGSAPGELYYPYDVAIAPDGTLVVCEFGNHRVQRFNLAGESLGVWGRPGKEPGELWNPWAVGVDSTGAVHVVDSNNHRVQRIRF